MVARIGDTLLATPALRALRAAVPNGRLEVLAHPSRRQLLLALPFIDALGGIKPGTAWYRGRLRPPRHDIAVVYGHDAALLHYAARAARRVVAFDQRDAALNARLWRKVAEPQGLLHAVHHRLMLAEALGARATDLRLAYATTAEECAWARQWVEQHVDGDGFLVGLQIASFATKRYRDWPLAHFAELARRVVAYRPGSRIIVLGDAASRKPAAALAAELGGCTVSAAGRLDLRQTAALIERLDLYVGVDTGPTHLAGALGVPMVTLYHCRHRGRYLAPLQHQRLRVLEHPASDAACSDATSMAELEVDLAWEAALSLLQPQQPRGR